MCVGFLITVVSADCCPSSQCASEDCAVSSAVGPVCSVVVGVLQDGVWYGRVTTNDDVLEELMLDSAGFAHDTGR